MPERTTQSSVTFLHPFSLAGLDGVQSAGTYTIDSVEQTLDNLSFVAYRRVSTTIVVPAVSTSRGRGNWSPLILRTWRLPKEEMQR